MKHRKDIKVKKLPLKVEQRQRQMKREKKVEKPITRNKYTHSSERRLYRTIPLKLHLDRWMAVVFSGLSSVLFSIFESEICIQTFLRKFVLLSCETFSNEAENSLVFQN